MVGFLRWKASHFSFTVVIAATVPAAIRANFNRFEVIWHFPCTYMAPVWYAVLHAESNLQFRL